MTATYTCDQCGDVFVFDEECILALHADDDCSPFSRMIRLCAKCAQELTPDE
ncbi:hypothetical protein [Photobacterium leiognathi]|uniref:hypothetical protein n=1 Tax=Photobacterium leiognathi TaxID=553611 RepID=UPI00298218FC|nr:hypothetical protein [Photobacterium leiognathi]